MESDYERDEMMVNEPLPVSADLYHLYLNLATGEWGDRADLAIITLTEPEVQRFAKLLPAARKRMWASSTRYFGNVANARATRRHLSTMDLPKP